MSKASVVSRLRTAIWRYDDEIRGLNMKYEESLREAKELNGGNISPNERLELSMWLVENENRLQNELIGKILGIEEIARAVRR